MRHVTDLPHAVGEDPHVEIPMPDGTRLAARIWRPVDAPPVPAVLEMIPYRKRDLTAVRDSGHHPYIAGHGYACVRVDLRGSGDSEGVLVDEYLETELADAEAVLAWLADQPWCDGTAAMMGISWGGFNALQVAARQPPQLRAIVTVCSTDDRYADDVHHMGGCLLTDNLSWASTMFAYNSAPPDPALVGDRWRDMWHQRLDGSGLWLDTWLRHQRRDAYWRHGSVCEDLSAIQVPVLAASGWADGYSNAVFRLLEGLEVPCEGFIGPWSHTYPHLGRPGPAIGFLQEVVGWFDRWMKDGSDADDRPHDALRIWVQESVPPATAYAERPGRWVAEPSWPSPAITDDVLVLAPSGGLVPEGTAEVPQQAAVIESPLSVGQFAGKWCSYNAPPDLPYDQREEDGGSMVFDSAALTDRVEVVGAPTAELDVVVDQPVAMIAVRLSDVAPEGRATRVTYGVLNLTHHEGHADPQPLEPGRRYRVSVALNGVAQAFPPGHRIRLAISTSYWPLAWPSPHPVRLQVLTGTSRLRLPVRPTRRDDGIIRPFGPAESAPPLVAEQVRPGEGSWTVTRDLASYRSALEVVKDLGEVRFPDIDWSVRRRADERYSWVGDDVLSVRGEARWTMAFARGDWAVETRTATVLTSDADAFHLHATLDAYEGARRVASRTWNTSIDRDLV